MHTSKYTVYSYHTCHFFFSLQRLKEAAEAEKARRGKTFNRDKEMKKDMEEMHRRIKATEAAMCRSSAAGASPPP